VLDPSCLETDFMLHNRHLLPRLRDAPEDLRPCMSVPSVRNPSEASAELATRRDEASLHHPPNHAEGARALGARIHAIADRAAAYGCAGSHSARMELHLSGFFSMVASIIKPWTASIRLGRALHTPTAPGLLSPVDCPSVDMGCFFERIGPAACEPARSNLAQFRFNLPELHREGLADAHAVPSEFRHLGSFWWVSQLTHRLLRPRRALRTMLRTAARQSGLAAALAAGRPVVGMHVRHGDACIESEASRTARSCEPLAVYMAAISAYAAEIGATTYFLATDSEIVLEEARTKFPSFTFLHVPNVSRTGITQSAPSEILDEMIKRRMRTGQGVHQTQQHALWGAVDALLLARCDVLVGKFSSGLFRAAYALAAARRGGGLPPFVSLDAPWCADYGVPSGYNEQFPRRIPRNEFSEQIKPEGLDAPGLVHDVGVNVFLC